MPNVKFRRDHHGFKAGCTFALDAGVADVYVGQGHAEYVADTPPLPKDGAHDVPGHAMRPVVTRDIPGPKDKRRNR